MKNWLRCIVGGTLAAVAISYMTCRDPLLDLLTVAKTCEQTWPNPFAFYKSTSEQFDFENWDAERNADLLSSERLVQQPGSGRLGRDSFESSTRVHQRGHYTTLRAFRESVGDKFKSTAQILDGNRQIALGSIVSPDGWIVTKGSEIPDSQVEIRLYDGSKSDGVVKNRRLDLDLALIKIERVGLIPITWSPSSEVPVGGWLATTDTRNLPIAIGVVSVSSRNVRPERAVLGVNLTTTSNGESGALVSGVIEGSGADRAGIQAGDIIQDIQGNLLHTRDDVLNRLSGLNAGERVDIRVSREGSPVSLSAQMMDLNNALLDPTEMEVNGDISARSTGFKNVIQHDSVLTPQQCGGPLVDVSGNAVGINIARAGRVSSYAIPAKIAAPAIEEMLLSVNGATVADKNRVVNASPKSTRTNSDLPTSVPGGIVIETLKPEVVVPPIATRPR